MKNDFHDLKSSCMDNTTIHQLIEIHAKNTPNHTAIIDKDCSYSYRELNQKANQLAHYLQKFGLKQETVIAIAIDRSMQLMIGLLAILKAGYAYAPLDAEHPKNHLQYILKDTEAPILITQSKSKDKFADYLGHIILIDQDWKEICSGPLHNPPCSVQPENLAYVIYTSGSTGKPKGVLIEHKSVLNYQKWFWQYCAPSPEDRIDFSSSIIFDMAVTTTITALVFGLQIIICPEEVKKNIYQYLTYLHENKINIIKLTPSYFKVLIQEAKNHAIELHDLQAIILGGEILHTKDCMAWLEMYPRHVLYNEYGPTETTVAVTVYKVTSENVSTLGRIVPIGKPGFHIECMLYDEHPIKSLGEIDELHIGGICLARGYLNQEALTARQFIFDPITDKRLYRTGDLCRYLPDGNIELIQRIDDQVKIRGYRIELGEIQACLAMHALIREAIVIVRENISGEKQLVGYYIPYDEKNSPMSNELRQYLQQTLPDYMVPAPLVMVKAFPLTANGKLDKKALLQLDYEEEHTAPRTPLESKLIEIWKKEFYPQTIDIDSHFFELGGHSLLAARIIVEIEKSLGKRIRLEDLYKAPTIRELTLIIESVSKTDKKYPTIDLLSDKDIIPLSDFQFMFWISHFFDKKTKKINIIDRRRLSGKLDITTLTFALKWIFKKHEVLTYKIAKYFPAQYPKKNITFQVIEEDLTTHAETETESKLTASMHELMRHKTWLKNTPLIVVKLFHLKNEISELQICVPHIVFDDASLDVLFSELSTAYIHYQNGSQLPSLIDCIQYKDYVLYEKNHLNQHLKEDIQFWENYLHNASLLTLPETEVIHAMENIPYSTYLHFPLEQVKNMRQIGANASVSFSDIFCASVSLTLNKLAEHSKDKVFINLTRSVRNNTIHDNIIGCFLRLDPIKVDLKSKQNLIELAKTIQQSRIDTEPHQGCSGMIKLACLNKNYRKKYIRKLLDYMISVIYCRLFRKSKINPTLFMMYLRLSSLRTKQHFVVNINLLHRFFSPKLDETLFGLELIKNKSHGLDLLNIDNILDICLFRNHDNAYLVISGNLRVSFREQIGNEIIKIISNTSENLHQPSYTSASNIPEFI